MKSAHETTLMAVILLIIHNQVGFCAFVYLNNDVFIKSFLAGVETA